MPIWGRASVFPVENSGSPYRDRDRFTAYRRERQSIMSLERQIVFLAVAVGVLALANYYVYRRLLRRLSDNLHRLSALLMAAIMGGEVVFVADLLFGFLPESAAVYMTFSVLVGATFMLFVVALFYDLTLTVAKRVPFDPGRRRAVKALFDAAVLIAAASYLWRGIRGGTGEPEINQVAVKIKGFPFDGFSIVQLTDLHIGRTLKRDFLQRVVERTNALRPDMVVITGDLVDLPAQAVRQDLQPLKSLEAPGYFVTGNHEYFHDVESILREVRALGIRPLANEAIQFGNDEGRINLVGLNDLTGGRFGIRPPDAETAYRRVEPSQPTIVLAHQPKAVSLVEGRRCDLMLSGHTHGGQIFPFGALVMLDQPYLAGLHEHGPDRWLFVSRGTGYWGPPLRVLAPSEISRIVIEAA